MWICLHVFISSGRKSGIECLRVVVRLGKYYSYSRVYFESWYLNSIDKPTASDALLPIRKENFSTTLCSQILTILKNQRGWKTRQKKKGFLYDRAMTLWAMPFDVLIPRKLFKPHLVDKIRTTKSTRKVNFVIFGSPLVYLWSLTLKHNVFKEIKKNW